jgi:ribosomal-protein-alanine N-acetyltransferase
MRAPERIITDRLLLRRPTPADAEAIFSTYSSDPDVTRFVGFARHQRIEDTRAFLEFSGEQWTNWPAGPYLMLMRSTGALIGSSGLKFETAQCAATGYVLAKPAWGQGYATEALRAMVDVARATAVVRLYAVCHHTHRASARVLEKAVSRWRACSVASRSFRTWRRPGSRMCCAMRWSSKTSLVQREKCAHNMGQPVSPSTLLGETLRRVEGFG